MSSIPVQTWIFSIFFRFLPSTAYVEISSLRWSSYISISNPQYKYMIISYIKIHSLSNYGINDELSIDQLPVGFIAQLLERCTGIAEVMGSIPVQAWIFSGFFFQLLKLKYRHCDGVHIFVSSYLSRHPGHSWAAKNPVLFPLPPLPFLPSRFILFSSFLKAKESSAFSGYLKVLA